MAGPVTSFAPSSRAIRRILTITVLVILAAVLVWQAPGGPTRTHAATKDSVTILGGEPATLDPAAQGDAGSAAVTAQLYEGLTAFDPSLTLRPALAKSWDILDGGRRIIFHLRPNLTFSDGKPLGGADVVRSWLRLIDPAHPSPLASLMNDVQGAVEYLGGRITDAASVGLTASGNDVEVRLTRPASDFPSVVAGPSFGIVAPGTPAGSVASGGYAVAAHTADEITLKANDRYWAGRPAIGTVHLRLNLGGKSPVDVFSAGGVDYTGISSFDATWIQYDRSLGPQLRSVPSLAVEYFGFDTRRPPFDDIRVRRAFALAVDWQRIVRLEGDGTDIPATSMVPPGIPGRSTTDFGVHQDLASARQLLADAGFAGGQGFPEVTYLSGGAPFDAALIRQIKDGLGIDVRYETMDFGPYFTRLAQDPPQLWSLGWSADYPGPNDFLGVLLGTAQSNDYGGWSSPEFDKAVADAGSATDPAAIRAAYDRAEAIVQHDVPVVPASYGASWALARTGLLGAQQNGFGFVRYAGLAWAP